MSGDLTVQRRLFRIVIGLGAAAILAAVVLIVTGWPAVRYVVAALAFLFAAAAMIYRADRRPRQKHTVK